MNVWVCAPHADQYFRDGKTSSCSQAGPDSERGVFGRKFEKDKESRMNACHLGLIEMLMDFMTGWILKHIVCMFWHAVSNL